MHTKFLRKILQLKQSTPLYMLYGECGRLPLGNLIKSRMISYWNRIITGDKNKISHTIYKFMLNIPNFESKWISKIKSILNEVGRTDIWLNQEYILNKNLNISKNHSHRSTSAEMVQ